MTEACANGVVFVFGKIMATLSYASIVGITPRRKKEKDIRKLFIATISERSPIWVEYSIPFQVVAIQAKPTILSKVRMVLYIALVRHGKCGRPVST